MSLETDYLFGTADWASICTSLFYSDRNLANSNINQRSIALFGVEPNICVFIWLQLSGHVLRETEPKHLLWGLSFLKLYEIECASSTRFQTDEKTFRKWIKIMVQALSQLSLVRFSIPLHFTYFTNAY